MSCCSKRHKKYEKRLKKNKIQVEERVKQDPIEKKRRVKVKNETDVGKKQREEFHKKFIAEIIPCGFCNEKFSIGDSELKINCTGCDKFFHCHIAGKCNGENCTIEINGKIEYSSYCLACVDPLTCKNGFCKCYKCS